MKRLTKQCRQWPINYEYLCTSIIKQWIQFCDKVRIQTFNYLCVSSGVFLPVISIKLQIVVLMFTRELVFVPIYIQNREHIDVKLTYSSTENQSGPKLTLVANWHFDQQWKIMNCSVVEWLCA